MELFKLVLELLFMKFELYLFEDCVLLFLFYCWVGFGVFCIACRLRGFNAVKVCVKSILVGVFCVMCCYGVLLGVVLVKCVFGCLVIVLFFWEFVMNFLLLDDILSFFSSFFFSFVFVSSSMK